MNHNKWIKFWLLTGLVMIFIQVMIGGITRLTGSGLSITKWEIVTGSIPPMSAEQWEKEFDIYKTTPQYIEINEGMEMGSVFDSGTFKFIYFWEWIHRFWARVMGIVFLFPFLFWVYKKSFSNALLRRLLVVVGLAALAAGFGWIMVASGLVERPWVNAYKLSIHLTIAFILFIYLFNTYLQYTRDDIELVQSREIRWLRNAIAFFVVILWMQIFLGGMMSGMKAAVVYPSWPDMNGEFIPQVLTNIDNYNVENVLQYDRNEWMPAIVQFSHRMTAYMLFVLGIVILYYGLFKVRISNINKSSIVFISMLITQMLLGIVTLINSKGSIPLLHGVSHQVFALGLLASVYYLRFIIR